MRSPIASHRRRIVAPLLGGLLVLAVAACGGSDSPKLADDPSRTPVEPAGKDAPRADTVVEVEFEQPENAVRALRERTVAVDEPTGLLRMRVTKMTYRGIVCGFTFRGGQPAGPVTIRMVGKTESVSFDSGALSVSWTGTDSLSVDSGSSSSNKWNFSAAANPNRNGPGWVVSLGGVTSPGPRTVPTEARCELRSPSKAFTPETGPIGYWAAFAAA